MRIEPPPPQSPPAAAAAARILSELLADSSRFRTSSEVGMALLRDPQHPDPKMVATLARRSGRIFGVWDGSTFRYPAFQFDADGQPCARVPELIEVLPRDSDGSNQDAALWLFAPDDEFDGRSPADIFPDNPKRVIRIACARRDGDDTSD